MHVALLGLSKVLRRLVDISFLGNQIKWLHILAFHLFDKVVFLVYPIGHQQEPRSLSHPGTSDMANQLFHMIRTVRRVGKEHIKARIRGWRRPDLVTVFLLVIDTRETEGFEMLNHSSIAVIRVIDTQVFLGCTVIVS